jgi:hypothetical protein
MEQPILPPPLCPHVSLQPCLVDGSSDVCLTKGHGAVHLRKLDPSCHGRSLAGRAGLGKITIVLTEGLGETALP